MLLQGQSAGNQQLVGSSETTRDTPLKGWKYSPILYESINQMNYILL